MAQMKKIVIVDDEKDVALLTAKRLRALGYDTTCFFKGEGVIDSMPQVNPDLVLLDILLPDISGFDLYQKLQAQDLTRHIPVVFFSANTSNENYCLGTLKADGFVKKPYEGAELSAIIQRTLERHHSA